MQKTLAIVGAGPKAAALVARAAVLRGRLPAGQVPRLIVIERDDIGSAWTGHSSYSNGFVKLCTPGEKDVGFPYNGGGDDNHPKGSIASELYSRFSWGAYQVAKGLFADWVDRDRDHPSHSRFANYLQWVFRQADQGIEIAEVKTIRHLAGKWRIDYEAEGELVSIDVDGVVLTGNGEPRSTVFGPDVDRTRILDAESFWARRDELANPDQTLEVAVAGDGGSAGTIVAWLAQRFAETGSRVFSISPLGTLFPRGDGHAERRWFTDPSDWKKLTIPHRKKIIDRTEAGVISMRNKRVIDSSTLIDYFVGYVDSVSSDADQKLQIKTTYDGVPGHPVGADYLINAIGFDSWTRLSLIDHPAAQGLAKLRSPMNQATLDAARGDVERTIEPDLSLPASAGFPPRLHIPALAGLAHGPGISNLGCLGVMAQLVLQTYEK